MNYDAFKQEYQGRRIDFDHSGTYLASDLIREFVFTLYRVNVPIESFQELWATPPTELIDYYYQSNDVIVKQGDIVMLGAHAVIANGEQDTERFEALEQDAVGSKTGIGDDAIRENWYAKSLITGIYRARFSPTVVETPVTQVEPEPVEIEVPVEVAPVTPTPVAKPYKHPTGALRVPVNRVEYKIITELNGYGYMSHAQTGDKPVQKLKVGNYYMTRQQAGMALIDTGENTKAYWINPEDNIVRPRISNFRPDTRSDYHWFKGGNAGEPRPLLYQATGDYMKRNKSGFVFSFKSDKENRAIHYKDLIYIAGTFKDGDHLYGVPAFERDDNTFGVAPSYGVFMSYLELSQDDYVPEEETIQDVQPVEAAPLVPVRRVTVKDQVTLVKAHGQKFIDGFIKKV